MMNPAFHLFFSLCLCASALFPGGSCSAQAPPADTALGIARDTAHHVGEIIIIRDSRLDDLLERHIRVNTEKESIAGYRVQLYSSSGRNAKTAADKIKSDFMAAFRDVEVYVQWVNPNYKVRAGNCRTRLEAEKLLREVAAVFPSSYIVQDQIRLPRLD